jgi:hypothetical protein
MMRGNLNFWDYLEVTTGLDRGKCKRIALTIENFPDRSTDELAPISGCSFREIVLVKRYTRQWKEWLVRR